MHKCIKDGQKIAAAGGPKAKENFRKQLDAWFPKEGSALAMLQPEDPGGEFDPSLQAALAATAQGHNLDFEPILAWWRDNDSCTENGAVGILVAGSQVLVNEQNHV